MDVLDQAFLDAKPVKEATQEDFDLKPELIDELTAKNKLDEQFKGFVEE